MANEAQVIAPAFGDRGLLQHWQDEGLSASTLKNRMTHLCWWVEKVGKAGILPADSTKLSIPERRYVTNESKAAGLSNMHGLRHQVLTGWEAPAARCPANAQLSTSQRMSTNKPDSRSAVNSGMKG